MGCGISTLFGFRWGRPSPLNDAPETTPATNTTTVVAENTISESTPPAVTTTEPAVLLPVTATASTTNNETATVDTTVVSVPTNEPEMQVIKENESKPVAEQVTLFVRPAQSPSPISKIPAEILVLILGMASDLPYNRRRLISTCYHWRTIMVETSWLWTSIRVITNRDTEPKFEKFIWNLTLQLERCGSLPLEVYWRTNMDVTQTTQLFSLLAQKAPFSRWRTLELSSYDGTILTDNLYSNMGEFTNLESFIVYGSQASCLLHLVNRSVGSKLTNFDNRYLYIPLVQFRNEMYNLIKYVDKFHLPYFSQDAEFELPANITDLKVNILPDVALPHVTTLTANANWIRSYKNRNLSSLITLDASFYQRDDMDQPLTLSSLQNLTVHSPDFTALTVLTAPCLQTLRYDVPVQEGYKKEINSMRQTLNHPNYNLSPYESLQFACPFPADLIERAMFKSPRITDLMFQIRDNRRAWDTIRRLFVEQPDWQREGCETEIVTTQTVKGEKKSDSKTVAVQKSKWWRLCPRLKRVRIELMWNMMNDNELVMWTSFLQRILEERFGGPLQSVTVVWNCGTVLTSSVIVSG